MRVKVAICLLFLFTFNLTSCFAGNGEITLESPDLFKVKYKEQVKKLNGSLFIDDAQNAQIIINRQQGADLEDIENLWNATVDNNQIIKFSLQKLAIPEEQRRIHSSLMAKTASALISGAAMLPSFMGMHYAIQSASYAGARLANNFLNKTNREKLENHPLTDSEAIELATLIEDLQDEIVINYYNYKGALNRLKDCRAQLILYNKNYSDALKKGDSLEIAVASALWDEGQIEEYQMVQEVKKYQLILQRLAGKDAIDKLHLAQFNLDTHKVDVNDLNFEKKKIKTKIEEEKKK